MPDFHWNSSYQVGHPEIDAQHEEMAAIMQELFRDQQAKTSVQDALGILGRLIAHTTEHNASEERLMLEYGYPATSDHKHEHEDLLQQLYVMREELLSRETGLSSASMLFLKQWLLNHILNSDRNLSAFLAHATAAAR